MLGSTAASEFATPNLDRFAHERDALHPPRHRFAALHARPPRHPLRRARLPVEAVGVDRAVGGVDHGHAAPGGRDDDARVRPSAPVRDRRRELPHRLQRAGTTSAVTRATRGARPPTRSAYGMPPSTRRPGAVDGGWFIRERFGIDDGTVGRRPLRPTPARGSAPRTTSPARARCAPPRRGCATRRAAPRPVDAVRRRVRSARAVRHPRAVGVEYDDEPWDDELVDLAAVRSSAASRPER